MRADHATPAEAPPRPGTTPTENPRERTQEGAKHGPTSDDRASDLSDRSPGDRLDDLIERRDLSIVDEHTRSPDADIFVLERVALRH
jgi:hypothetical protein